MDPGFVSRIDPHGAVFAQQRQQMLACLAQVREAEARVRATEAARRETFAKRGQLLPRERIQLLLDRGSPFLELCGLAGYGQHDDTDGALAGGNVIAGIGYVSGVRCLVHASNSAIKGGTLTPWGMRKILRIQEIALKQKLPLIALIESGGANLLYQAEVFIEGGRVFANQAALSAAGIVQITVVHGSSTAGGAYMPGLSDYVVMVRKQARVFLAGPPLLLAATGEIAEEEALGGAQMHAQIAGTSEFTAADDADGIRIARDIVASLDWNRGRVGNPAVFAFPTHACLEAGYEKSRQPAFEIDELCGAVPIDFRQPYDCREVIVRLVDGSEFLEFKAEYDHQTVCVRARIHGHPVGIVANNGPITVRGASKAAQFMQLCEQSATPLVFLMNTTGYMVGTESEQGGIVKLGARMIQAVANVSVPKLTVVIGASFGAGNYGMCGRGFSPDFIFAWPNARTAVMGGETAARVLGVVARERFSKTGRAPSAAETAQLEAMEKAVIEQFERESSALAASARLFDDGLIDPRDTRKVLGLCLSICLEARARKLQPNSFGVARG